MALSLILALTTYEVALARFGLAFFGIIAACGVLGFLAVNAKARLDDPEVREKVAQAVDKATATSSELSQVGVKAARVSGGQLMPRLQYLFSFSGCVARQPFIISQLVSGVFMFVFIGLAIAAYETGWSLVFLLLLLVLIAHLLAFGARRTRDTGASHWWYLLVLVPPVNLALIVALFLVPTGEFANRRL